MIRPRSASGVSTCSSVFDAAICSIMKKPVEEQGRSRAAASGEREGDQREAEAGRRAGHPAAEAARAGRARPAAARAHERADAGGAQQHAHPAAPPPSTWSAKTGISTAYGMPTTLTSPSSSSSARTGGFARTKAKASAIARSAGACRRGRAGATRISSSAPITAAKLTAFSGEAPALADGRHQDAGDRRADDARRVDGRGVEGDRVRHVLAAHHLDHERLARRDVERVDDAERGGDDEDLRRSSRGRKA